MSELEKFFEILDYYKKTLAWALGGSAILPLLASFSEISPPWPQETPLLSSLFTAVSVIFSFQFFRSYQELKINRIMIISLSGATFCLMAYLAIFSTFTFQIPTTGQVIYLGCGWSDFSKEISSDFLIDPDQGCPGQYSRILESAEYESEVVWLRNSVSAIKILSIFLWLTTFSLIAIFISSFLVHQSSR